MKTTHGESIKISDRVLNPNRPQKGTNLTPTRKKYPYDHSYGIHYDTGEVT